MSRLSTYLESMKLAKMHLVAAEEAARKDHRKTFEDNLFSALDNVVVAMNNLASIAFNAKPKKPRKIKAPTTLTTKLV